VCIPHTHKGANLETIEAFASIAPIFASKGENGVLLNLLLVFNRLPPHIDGEPLFLVLQGKSYDNNHKKSS